MKSSMARTVSRARLSAEEQQLLQGYADGELEAAEEQRAARLLAEKPDAHEFILQTFALGNAVHALAMDKAIDFDAVDAIMGKLEQERKASTGQERGLEPQQRSTLVSVPAAPGSAHAIIARGSDRDGGAEKLRSVQPVRSNKVALFPKHLRWGVGTAFALAAAAALTFAVERNSAQRNSPTAGSELPNAGESGVFIDHVDSPNGVSVFYLPAAVGVNASSVVVWMDDDAPMAAPPMPAPSTTTSRAVTDKAGQFAPAEALPAK
jgi:hypothetical protein